MVAYTFDVASCRMRNAANNGGRVASRIIYGKNSSEAKFGLFLKLDENSTYLHFSTPPFPWPESPVLRRFIPERCHVAERDERMIHVSMRIFCFANLWLNWNADCLEEKAFHMEKLHYVELRRELSGGSGRLEATELFSEREIKSVFAIWKSPAACF